MRDVSLLHPNLQVKCRSLIDECKQAGVEIIITQTLRTEKEQNDLYAQGRTKPGMIVTNLKYPNSLHCWGMAFDVAVMVNGKVNWERLELYRKVGQIGKRLGLEWGGDFKSFPDMPHFQLPGLTVAGLVSKYLTPSAFVSTFPQKAKKEGGGGVTVDWKEQIITEAMEAGLITERHKPDEMATKWFVLAVALNLLKALKGGM